MGISITVGAAAAPARFMNSRILRRLSKSRALHESWKVPTPPQLQYRLAIIHRGNSILDPFLGFLSLLLFPASYPTLWLDADSLFRGTGT